MLCLLLTHQAVILSHEAASYQQNTKSYLVQRSKKALAVVQETASRTSQSVNHILRSYSGAYSAGANYSSLIAC